MRRPVHNALILALSMILVLAAGCQDGQKTTETDGNVAATDNAKPDSKLTRQDKEIEALKRNAKRTRLIAAENIELKKQLDQLSKQIEDLTKEHAVEMKQSQASLAECRKKTESCEKARGEEIAKNVEEMLAVVMERTAALSTENEGLKAEITDLKAQLKKQGDAEK